MIPYLQPPEQLQSLKLEILLNVDILIAICKFKFDWFGWPHSLPVIYSNDVEERFKS